MNGLFLLPDVAPVAEGIPRRAEFHRNLVSLWKRADVVCSEVADEMGMWTLKLVGNFAF